MDRILTSIPVKILFVLFPLIPPSRAVMISSYVLTTTMVSSDQTAAPITFCPSVSWPDCLHWMPVPAACGPGGLSTTPRECPSAQGRVQKFLLNRLVEFAIKWVGGGTAGPLRKSVKKRHVKSGWGRGVLVDF